MTVFYYTATGNSLYVAKMVGGGAKSIPQELKKTDLHYEDDVIGIVYPCYVYGIPASVQTFLERATWKAQYTFAIITYGFTSGAAVTYLKKAAELYHKNFDYVGRVKMVDNYLLTFDVDKEVRNEEKKKTDEKLDGIKADIKSRRRSTPRVGVVGKVFEMYGKSYQDTYTSGEFSRQYHVADNCIHCGVCAKVCPTGNISVEQSVQFHDRCEGCMACIHACPQKAIHLDGEKSQSRYRNKGITLQEIIASNQQQ